MPEIRPFRALRYDASSVGDLSDVLCPPYDILSQVDEEALRARHAVNFVRLILPREEQDLDPYHAARELLERWREQGTLRRDLAPAYYFYEQEYTLRGSAPLRRRGIFALVRLHDFSERVVLPHEETLPAPREDRYRLLKTTGAHLDPIFSLYSDPQHIIDRLFEEAARGPCLVDVRDADGIRHRLWLTDREEDLSRIASALATGWVLIADGHHRYESALKYARSHAPANGPPKPHQYVLMVLCNIEAPGLSVLPVHRLVHSLSDFDLEAWLHRLEVWFERRTLPLPEDPRRAEAVLEETLAPHRERGGAVAVAVDPRRADLLVLRPGVDRARELGASVPGALLGLDVSLVHALLLERSLSITAEEQLRQTRLRYAKSAPGALEALAGGSAQAAIFLNPTPIESVVRAARAGLRMPSKSTFFYPKMISGLVIHPFDERG
ncbi:MAG: DUF1015 domain-containing protein [Acidobacteriota bacterium]